MNNTFLTSIEETIKSLATAPQPDPRDALRAARVQEFAERGQPLEGVTPGSDSLASQYLHEAEGEPQLRADVARQYWAAPYNNDYLVVTFPPDAAFKALDVVALSSKEDLTFDDLKAAAESEGRQVVAEMTQPLALQGKPWITSISASEAKAGGALYLHHFFVAKGRPGEGVITRRTARRKILDASSEPAQIENPYNVDGKTQAPHPSIPPHRLATTEGISANASHAATALSADAGTPFTRLFVTLDELDTDSANPWDAYVVLNLDRAPGQVNEYDDYIALADHDPKGDAYAYLYNQWQVVRDLGPQLSYRTGTLCIKWINWNLPVVDLDKLEKMYIFYGRWDKDKNKYVIVGNPASYKTQKRWMEDLLPYIGQKRLHEIVIPGTHDSGTFDPESKGYLGTKNAQTQNLDFPGQLALGIRYFDCRIQNWPKAHPAQPFYFFHGKAWMWTEITDLISALNDFFVKDNSRDIVILDFCYFDGFNQPSDYTKLFELFTKHPVLGLAMMSPNEASQLTINELIAWGKRLYLLCGDATARASFNLGESINIDAEWPHTTDINTLKSKLDKQVADHAGWTKLWSLQAILSPEYPTPIFPYANKVNPVLRHWVVNEWWDKVNVVFCDFPAGTDLVHAARVSDQKLYDPKKGNLFRYEHTGWQTGAPLPAGPPVGTTIGQGGWTGFKSVFASSDGWIYAIDWYGNLQRYHDTHWQDGGGPMTDPAVAISSDNWQQYRAVFASSNGLIYAITGDYKNPGTGKLWRWKDTGGEKLGNGTLIDGGWENYKIVFASSDGMIYAIDSLGKLWRWKDTGADKLGNGTQIDVGWENYKTAFATSDGVIYGINWRGDLAWWRDTGGNSLGDGKMVGTGWGDFRMVFATSEGRIYGVKG